MLSWPPNQIEVDTEKGSGYILYVCPNGPYYNDEFAIVLKQTGEILHMTTKQFTVTKNHTYEIKTGNHD